MRSIIGMLMYTVITNPDLRGILNAPMRSLKVHTRLRQRKHDHLTPFSYEAGASFETVKYALSHLEGRPFASKATFPVYEDLIFIMNDAAGLGDDDFFRGGVSWVWIPVHQLLLWTTRASTDSQLNSHHSTSLETMNGNCTLLAILLLLEAFPSFDVVEICDNQSDVYSLRRLACNSDSMNVHTEYRRNILQTCQHSHRIFTIWSNRTLGTLADMLSKFNIPDFLAGIAKRGFPTPHPTKLARPAWYA
jgi:hypothetical protein